jgi:ABC-type polysaccharide/polyol phosphate transport system ATPase subunit
MVDEAVGVDDDDSDELEESVEDETEPVLSVEGWAIRDITLDVERGSALAIVGDESSGSATLMRILARLSTPTEGSIVVRAPIVPALDGLRGLVQPARTILENGAILGRMLGAPKARLEARVGGALAFAGLAEHSHVRAGEMDRAAHRRLIVASAFQLDPAVVVADAVMLGGEQWFVDRLDEHIQRRRSEGLALLVAGGKDDVLRRLCDRAVVMAYGRIVAAGALEVVLARAVDQQRTAPEKPS